MQLLCLIMISGVVAIGMSQEIASGVTTAPLESLKDPATKGPPLLPVGGECPSFTSKYEGDTLIIEIIPGKCEMIVAVQDQTHLFPGMMDMWRLTGRGQVFLPMVAFRGGNSSTNSIVTGCPMIPLRYLGPRVILDTVPGECQIVLGIRTFPVMMTQPPRNGDNLGRQLIMGSRMVTRAVFERTNGIL